MSGFLDTSVVVRYLTDDPPDLAEVAARIIDEEEGLHVTDVVLVETAYVLTSVYQVPRPVVVDHLIAFLRKENVAPYTLSEDAVLQALLLCRPSNRVSFADAMVMAAARSAGAKVVYSFDRRFPGDGLDIRSEP